MNNMNKDEISEIEELLIDGLIALGLEKEDIIAVMLLTTKGNREKKIQGLIDFIVEKDGNTNLSELLGEGIRLKQVFDC